MRYICSYALLFGMASCVLYAQTPSSAPAVDTPTPNIAPCRQGVELCVAEKRKEFSDRGTLEMLIYPIVRDVAGDHVGYWRIVEVFSSGVAEKAGLKEGDVVVEWNGDPLPREEPRFLVPRLEMLKIGEEVAIDVMRSGKRRRFSLKASKPDETTMEYWLLTYVKNNFSDAEFQEYSSKAAVQLVRAPKG